MVTQAYERTWRDYYLTLMARRRKPKSPVLKAMLARSNRYMYQIQVNNQKVIDEPLVR
jgi:hypothetical protein